VERCLACEADAVGTVERCPADLTPHLSFPGRDIVSFDVNNLDQIVERIPGKETRAKW
jgi:hypothetical protein